MSLRSVCRSAFVFSGLVVSSLAAVPHLSAEGQPLPTITPRTVFGSKPPSEPSRKLLLLDNGKVIQGLIQEGPTGYVVIKPEGKLVFAFDQVRFEAEDLQDAYRQLRNTLPDHSASAHVELARWCVTYGLMDEARKEAREALRREPGSRIARNILEKIDQQLFKTNDLPVVKKTNGGYSMLGDAKPLMTVEALGGLPREVASDFVLKLQPLLVNRCATGGCHGPGSGNGFELQRVKIGQGSSKSSSERNLAAVLALIDREQPGKSPLLTKLRGDTKSAGLKPPHGGLSSGQMQIVRSWIDSQAKNSEETAVAKSGSGSTAPRENSRLNKPRPGRKTSDIPGPQTDADTPIADAPPSQDNDRGASEITRERNAQKVDSKTESSDGDDGDENFFRQLLRERKPDAFDPEQFNGK